MRDAYTAIKHLCVVLRSGRIQRQALLTPPAGGRYWTPSVAGLVAELVDAREALADLRQVGSPPRRRRPRRHPPTAVGKEGAAALTEPPEEPAEAGAARPCAAHPRTQHRGAAVRRAFHSRATACGLLLRRSGPAYPRAGLARPPVPRCCPRTRTQARRARPRRARLSSRADAHARRHAPQRAVSLAARRRRRRRARVMRNARGLVDGDADAASLNIL